MLHVLKDLDTITVEASKAVICGPQGYLELMLHSPQIISIFYRFNELIVPEQSNQTFPGLLCDAFLATPTPAWESWQETEDFFELNCGKTSVCVDKVTARVAVYKDGKLVHGGCIGDKDLVVSQYPLRVQKSQMTHEISGKFNFRLEPEDAFFGLGEKSGGLNKRNRSFKLYNRDALAYDAGFSDPLYKSVPFYIKTNRKTDSICGLFFPNLKIEEINFGVESVFYYSVTLADWPMGYFVMTGENYKDIISSYCSISGMPALPPLFSFGYLTSSMGYTEPDDAQERVLEFFRRVEKADIPCEGMYFSSGYTKTENGERYTFVWNRKKFPEPEKFMEELRKRGYHICCNVKPGILSTHPWYDSIAHSGAFVEDSEGNPLVSYYWSNSASFIDFSRKEGYDWWIDSLTQNIIYKGVSGVWNDNNEFEAEDEALPMQKYKNFLPVKMAQASYEALRKANPGKRPWLISRSGYSGLQRYARTWTGDNVSNYSTLKYNIAMGMNLGLSGLPIYGHDIGGFVGPKPDEELLLRWCQSAVFQPRFVMHSWKPDGWITEPWSFSSRLGAIRDFIRERYRFLPYIYDLAIRAMEYGIPLETPVSLEFPNDPELSYESLDRMAGDAILVPGPPERGQNKSTIQLPAGADWLDPECDRLIPGGMKYVFDYPLDAVRYFFRSGTIVPEAHTIASVGKSALTDYLFQVNPPSRGDSVVCIHNEDDGESDFVPGSYWRYQMKCVGLEEDRYRFTATREQVAVGKKFTRTWRFHVPSGFSIIGPNGERCDKLKLHFEAAPETIEFNIEGEYRHVMQ